MAYSSRPERPPLRDLNLDALSDEELEAHLFGGEMPEEEPSSDSWLSPLSWLLLCITAVAMLALSKGNLISIVAVGAALFYFTNKGTSASSFASSFSLPSFSSGYASTSRWTRSRSGRKVMGVCSGLAACAGFDVTLVRIAFLASFFVVGPLAVPGYFLLAYALPPESCLSREQRLNILRES